MEDFNIDDYLPTLESDSDDDYNVVDNADFNDFEDFDGGDYFSVYGSDVLPEEFISLNPNYSENTELRFHSLVRSHCGVFNKNGLVDLKWCGFDKNMKFVYGVLFADKFYDDEFKIVKYSPVTNGFYVLKRFDGKSYRFRGFDEQNRTFLFTKIGTMPEIVLYDVASDIETCYRCNDDSDFLFFLLSREAVACIDRQEWIVSINNGFFYTCFRRAIFDEDAKSVSFTTIVTFPLEMSQIDHVFVYDKDTIIFLESCWNRILVYSIENGQFSVERFSIDNVAEIVNPNQYWLEKLNIIKGVRDFYAISTRLGVCLKLDFFAKKWQCVNISVSVGPGDLNNSITPGDFMRRFQIALANCTLIGQPENGFLCALFTQISKKRRRVHRMVQIVCCVSSQWSFCLKDLCVSKLFREFRKIKRAEKITDIEFCRQVGISPDLIQKYVGSSV